MKKCNLCGREIEKIGTTCLIHIPTSENIVVGFSSGYKMYIICFECNQSYLSQFFGMTNKEIDDYIKWDGKIK